MYGAYLRKSRADLSLEKENKIDTLKRHKALIMELAKSRGIYIDKWYQEVVSAETIENRPEVKKMLLEIEKGLFEGIFVIDIDRLARGDTADQARIFKSFAYSSTKIITLNKIYDPNNEVDEEFFEFGLFMSRREYKLINKRLNRGRISSVKEGKYVGSVCPYGYTKEKIKGDKGYKLIPLKEEADIVKLIFEKATNNTGSQKIANLLNTMKVKPRKSSYWSYSTIRDIISNPTYYGMIKWNRRKTEKKLINGVVYKSRPKHKDYILVKGLHEPLIDQNTFYLANKKKKDISLKKNNPLQNPLAGLIKCYFCNHAMQRKTYKENAKDFLICTNINCKNCGSLLEIIEERIVNSLIEYFSNHIIILPIDHSPTLNFQSKIKIIEEKINKLNNQLNNIYDLLEQGVYDNKTFIDRKKLLEKQIDNLLIEKETTIKKNENKNSIPNIYSILKDYYLLSIDDRNKLLKSIINKIYYKKIKKGKNHKDDFTLKILLNV